MTERPLERPSSERQSSERQVRPGNALLDRLFASGEQATQSVVPMMTSVARANMELVSLSGRRAQAYLDLPKTLTQCRGPQDLFAAQAQFWQVALEDYTTCNRRMVAALSAHNSVAAAGDEAGAERRQRDTLTFPDVFGLTPWAFSESEQRRRDAENRAA